MYVGSSADGSSVYQRLVRSHTDVLLAYFLHKPLLRCCGRVCYRLWVGSAVFSKCSGLFGRSAAQRSAVQLCGSTAELRGVCSYE